MGIENSSAHNEEKIKKIGVEKQQALDDYKRKLESYHKTKNKGVLSEKDKEMIDYEYQKKIDQLYQSEVKHDQDVKQGQEVLGSIESSLAKVNSENIDTSSFDLFQLDEANLASSVQGISIEAKKYAQFNEQIAERATQVSSMYSAFMLAVNKFEEMKANDTWWSGDSSYENYVDAINNQVQILKSKFEEAQRQIDEAVNHSTRMGEVLDSSTDKLKEKEVVNQGETQTSIDNDNEKLQQQMKMSLDEQTQLTVQADNLRVANNQMLDYQEKLVMANEMANNAIIQQQNNLTNLESQIQIVENELGSIASVYKVSMTYEDWISLSHNPNAYINGRLGNIARTYLENTEVQSLVLNYFALKDAANKTTSYIGELQNQTVVIQNEQGNADVEYQKLLQAQELNAQGQEQVQQTIDKTTEAQVLSDQQKIEMDAYYEGNMSELDYLDLQISSNVLDTNISNREIVKNIDGYVKSLASCHVEAKGGWEKAWDSTVGMLAKGCGWVVEKIVDVATFIPNMIRDFGLDHPEIGESWWFKTLTFPIELQAGVIEGAGELVGGVFTMIEQPSAALNGLGGLIGRDPITGEWSLDALGNSWGGFAKAIFAVDEFENGNYGRGTGKAVANIASFFIGGEAVGACKASATAGKLARASGMGIMESTGVAAVDLCLRTYRGATNTVKALPGKLASFPETAIESTGKFLSATEKGYQTVKRGVNTFKNAEGGVVSRLRATADAMPAPYTYRNGARMSVEGESQFVREFPEMSKMERNYTSAMERLDELGNTEQGLLHSQYEAVSKYVNKDGSLIEGAPRPKINEWGKIVDYQKSCSEVQGLKGLVTRLESGQQAMLKEGPLKDFVKSEPNFGDTLQKMMESPLDSQKFMDKFIKKYKNKGGDMSALEGIGELFSDQGGIVYKVSKEGKVVAEAPMYNKMFAELIENDVLVGKNGATLKITKKQVHNIEGSDVISLEAVDEISGKAYKLSQDLKSNITFYELRATEDAVPVLELKYLDGFDSKYAVQRSSDLLKDHPLKVVGYAEEVAPVLSDIIDVTKLENGDVIQFADGGVKLHIEESVAGAKKIKIRVEGVDGLSTVEIIDVSDFNNYVSKAGKGSPKIFRGEQELGVVERVSVEGETLGKGAEFVEDSSHLIESDRLDIGQKVGTEENVLKVVEVERELKGNPNVGSMEEYETFLNGKPVKVRYTVLEDLGGGKYKIKGEILENPNKVKDLVEGVDYVDLGSVAGDLSKAESSAAKMLEGTGKGQKLEEIGSDIYSKLVKDDVLVGADGTKLRVTDIIKTDKDGSLIHLVDEQGNYYEIFSNSEKVKIYGKKVEGNKVTTPEITFDTSFSIEHSASLSDDVAGSLEKTSKTENVTTVVSEVAEETGKIDVATGEIRSKLLSDFDRDLFGNGVEVDGHVYQFKRRQNMTQNKNRKDVYELYVDGEMKIIGDLKIDGEFHSLDEIFAKNNSASRRVNEILGNVREKYINQGMSNSKVEAVSVVDNVSDVVVDVVENTAKVEVGVEGVKTITEQLKLARKESFNKYAPQMNNMDVWINGEKYRCHYNTEKGTLNMKYTGGKKGYPGDLMNFEISDFSQLEKIESKVGGQITGFQDAPLNINGSPAKASRTTLNRLEQERQDILNRIKQEERGFKRQSLEASERGGVPAVVEERGGVPAVVEERGGVPAVVEEHGGVPAVVEEHGGVPAVVEERGGVPAVVEKPKYEIIKIGETEVQKVSMIDITDEVMTKGYANLEKGDMLKFEKLDVFVEDTKMIDGQMHFKVRYGNPKLKTLEGPEWISASDLGPKPLDPTKVRYKFGNETPVILRSTLKNYKPGVVPSEVYLPKGVLPFIGLTNQSHSENQVFGDVLETGEMDLKDQKIVLDLLGKVEEGGSKKDIKEFVRNNKAIFKALILSNNNIVDFARLNRIKDYNEYGDLVGNINEQLKNMLIKSIGLGEILENGEKFQVKKPDGTVFSGTIVNNRAIDKNGVYIPIFQGDEVIFA